MKTQIILLVINIVLTNLSFLLSFLVRYGLTFPSYNFLPYRKSFVFVTLINISALSLFGVYKRRFRSSWDLFRRIASGLFLGTLLSMAFLYVFRIKWGAFPTSIFVISFLVNLLLIFKANQFILKAKKRIKKQVIIIGEGKVDDIVGKKANVERKQTNQVRELLEYSNIDEIIVSERISDTKDLNLLLYLGQKLKAEILFSPAVYIGLLPKRINGDPSVDLVSTFVGRQSDLDEFFITIIDISISLTLLVLAAVPMLITSVLIKLTSKGEVVYKQTRVGKDGETFTLYKFRTMVKDAEKKVGPVLATQDDHRITRIGRVLRRTRMDELPQLFNVLRGDMSLVGPRPERPHFVRQHKVLHELRLAIKPGLTGLAQIRSFYDLKPRHKIKYDYLYIQKRSLLLNLYILFLTVPVIFSRKGW